MEFDICYLLYFKGILAQNLKLGNPLLKVVNLTKKGAFKNLLETEKTWPVSHVIHLDGR